MFKDLTVTHSLSSKKICSFVVVDDSGNAPYKYGDTIVIPYLEGILFSGVVNNTQKIQAYQISNAPQLFWKVTCEDDFAYLERSLCRNIDKEDYENVSPASLLKTILGDSWWMNGGEYDTITDLDNVATITYNPNNQSKSDAVVNILSQVGYDWRLRRPSFKATVESCSTYGNEVRLTFTPELPFTTDLERYIITTSSNEEVPIYSQVLFISGDGKYNLVCRIKRIVDEGTLELDNYPDDITTTVSSGDEFIITLHPILEASPFLDNVCDREFTVNEDMFQFDVQEDESSIYNAVTVRTQTYDGESYTSYLPAVYNIDSKGVWSNCTYINTSHSSGVNGYPDAYVSGAIETGAGMQVYVSDPNNEINRFLVDEWISFGGKESHKIEAVSTDNSGNTILSFSASSFNGGTPRIQTPLLRHIIRVDDASALGIGNSDSITIGNEVYPRNKINVDTYNNYILLDNNANLHQYRKSPHMSGVLVRNSGIASESNPQSNSPAAHFGFMRIKSINANTGSNPALADRIATTALATGCVSSMTGKGTIIYTDFYKIVGDGGDLTNQVLEVGDVINVKYGSLYNEDGTSNPDGLIETQFRISSINFALDTGKVDIEFGNSPDTIGDYLVSINTTIGRV